MVSSITPGAAGATALGADTRYVRPQTNSPPQAGDGGARADRVHLGDAAAWSAARESVRQGLTQLGAALSAGRDVLDILGRIQDIAARAADDPATAQANLDDALAKLMERVDAALADGARILAGEDLSVQAEPGAPAVTVAGVDLRGALNIAASVEDPEALRADALRAREAVQASMDRFLEAMRALNAHQGFMGAAEGAMNAGVRADLDADAARLLALKVRQGLDASGGGSIANVEPQAVLSLFRA